MLPSLCASVEWSDGPRGANSAAGEGTSSGRQKFTSSGRDVLRVYKRETKTSPGWIALLARPVKMASDEASS